MVVLNRQELNPQKFGEESVTRYSEVISVQFDSQLPSFFRGNLMKTRIEEKAKLTGTRIADEMDFYQVQVDGTLKTSLRTNYPSDVKFTSFQLYADDKIPVVQREVYNLFNYLSDLGGLSVCLYRILLIILTPLSQFSLRSLLANRLFTVNKNHLEHSHGHYFYGKKECQTQKCFTPDKQQTPIPILGPS